MKKFKALSMLPKRCLKNIYFLTDQDKKYLDLNQSKQYCMLIVLIDNKKDINLFSDDQSPRYVRNLFKFFEKQNYPEYSADPEHGFVYSAIQNMPSYALYRLNY